MWPILSGENMSVRAEFGAKFAQAVLALGVQNVFVLTAKKFHDDVFTEFEISDVITAVQR